MKSGRSHGFGELCFGVGEFGLTEEDAAQAAAVSRATRFKAGQFAQLSGSFIRLRKTSSVAARLLRASRWLGFNCKVA